MDVIIGFLTRIEKLFFKMLSAITSEPLTILPILVFLFIIGTFYILKIPNISEELKEKISLIFGFALIVTVIALLFRGCMQDEYFRGESIKKEYFIDNNEKTQKN